MRNSPELSDRLRTCRHLLYNLKTSAHLAFYLIAHDVPTKNMRFLDARRVARGDAQCDIRNFRTTTASFAGERDCENTHLASYFQGGQTLALFPEVESPIKTSPLAPSASTCRRK